MKKRVKALHRNLPCTGLIEISSKTENTAYVVWSFYDLDNKFLASLSHSYFFEKGTSDNEEIFRRVKDQIATYTVGREKPFSRLEFEVE